MILIVGGKKCSESERYGAACASSVLKARLTDHCALRSTARLNVS